MEKGNFTASLHTHVRSLCDADMNAKALCAKIKEMGGKGVAITDHGSLSAIEDFRRVFAAEGLKLVPGCELYVDGGLLGRTHLIVLAKNDEGYKSLAKIVTAGEKNLQGGFPVVTKDALFALAKKDDLIVTSACMQGVLCSILLQNESVQKKIDSLRKKQDKSNCLSASDTLAITVRKECEEAEKALTEAIVARDETKLIAEKKYTARLKKVEKSGNAEERAALDKEMEETTFAIDILPSLKEDVESRKKELSAKKKALAGVEEAIERFNAYEAQMAELSKELRSEEELYIEAKREAEIYKEFFGSNFYIEVQNHGIPQEAICYPAVVKIAKDLNIPLVAANDVHILDNTEDERLKRQILRSLRFGQFEEEHVGDNELYLKTDVELAVALLKILPADAVREALNNIAVIFDQCNVTFAPEKHYPKFSKTEDANEIIDREVEKGVRELFPMGLDETYKKRLARELDVIKSMGYADYHLVVKDFLEYARLLGYVPIDRLEEVPLSIEGAKAFIKENGYTNPCLTTGPGRGSAAGSLACFTLGITKLDPLKYGLLFERFLNPERVSMPDIDSDIATSVRWKVIEYVKAKYGEDAVCGIMTITTQGVKGSIRCAARFFGLKKYENELTSLGDTIAKIVPKAEGEVKFSSQLTTDGNFPDKDWTGATISLKEFLEKKFADNADALEIIRWASVIEGSVTAYGAHAAGIVISDNDDVGEYIPLRKNEELGMMTTQCDMVQIEENGLLKFDFLGLTTLDVITDTIRMVEKTRGIKLNPLQFNLNDTNVYREIFAKGKTNAVFQFESDGMKSMLKRFKPETFEDLIILVSMFRPGPLQYLDGVIDVKNGVEPMTFICPELEPILGKTYGAIVYQEQVMEIFQKLAGYTFGGADTVRRYMSKKKKDKLAKEREAFVYGDAERGIVGCVDNGIDVEVADELFSQMEDFAKYAFNKSHAACYALNAFITAYLKYYYPAEFFASALNWAKSEKIAGLMYEASNMGVKCLAPDINVSDIRFTVINGEIRFGLMQIAGVKNHAVDIIECRKSGTYKSLKDFFVRVKPNVKVLENLISAGAFDSFHKNRKAMIAMIEELKSVCKKIADKESVIASAKYLIPFLATLKTDAEVIDAQTSAGFKAVIKEITTVASLEAKLARAEEALKVAYSDLNCIVFHKVEEDKKERMKKERELLGIYVTEHPMDFYPEPAEVGASCVSETEAGDMLVYGVITDIKIKNRKSDGAKMAFFNIEDRSGDMEVAVFTKAYKKIGELLNEGSVVLLSGKCNEQESDDEGTVRRQFIAENLEFVEAKQPAILLSVSSFALFHLDHEEFFRENYEDENGRRFLIYDAALDEVREMTYRVKPNVIEFPSAEEIF